MYSKEKYKISEYGIIWKLEIYEKSGHIGSWRLISNFNTKEEARKEIGRLVQIEKENKRIQEEAEYYDRDGHKITKRWL